MIIRALIVLIVLMLGYRLYRRVFIEKHCLACGEILHKKVLHCPACGTNQTKKK